MSGRLPYSATMRQRLRASAALAAAALGLHQLRYLIGHGEEAGAALARGGHEYLALATPLAGLLVALALVELTSAWQHRQAPERTVPLSRRWAGAAAALVLIYVVQEAIEAALVAGRPDGLAGLGAANGWAALPLAVGLALLIAFLLGRADALLLRRSRPDRVLPRPVDDSPPPARELEPARAPLARHLAGRSPPLPAC